MPHYTKDQEVFDVIIVGGSYARLSAVLSLGRPLRRVLLIDAADPCNKQTPHSHNFLTQDGSTPKEISNLALSQVLKYESVTYINGKAIDGNKNGNHFEISDDDNNTFKGKILVFATGLTDNMPSINGFSECSGISVIHCPYCHGYEVKNKKTGIILNGDKAFEFSKLIYQWTKDLTLFTNGKSTLTSNQSDQLKAHNINKKEIEQFDQQNGIIRAIIFKDQSIEPIAALYAKPKFEQQSNLPAAFKCEFNKEGTIIVDSERQTTIEGIYACGDNLTVFRSVAVAVHSGTVVGGHINHKLAIDSF